MPAAAVPTTPQSQRGIEDSPEKRTEEDRKYNGDSVAPDAACSSSENEPTGNEDSSSTNLGSGATTDCCAAARFVGGFTSCFSNFAGTAAAAVGTAAFVGECFTHRSSSSGASVSSTSSSAREGAAREESRRDIIPNIFEVRPSSQAPRISTSSSTC